MIDSFWMAIGFLLILWCFLLVRVDLYKIKKHLGLIKKEEKKKNV